MKKRGIIDKLISAAGSILFVGLIRTDAPAWQLLILFVFMYELTQELCRTMRKEARKNRRRHYITVTRRDARRWAGTRIGWPMKEVG